MKRKERSLLAMRVVGRISYFFGAILVVSSVLHFLFASVQGDSAIK